MMYKSTISIITTLCLCVSSLAQDKVTHQSQYRYLVDRINGIYIPKDIDEAIDTLDTILSAEDKQYLTDSTSTMRGFVAATHFGLGMWMRNNWGLWGGSRLQRYFRDRQVFHPDDMSGEILKAYYKKKIQGMEYSAEEAIEPDNVGDNGIKIIRYFSRDWWRMRRSLSDARRELKEDGFRKGGFVYFQYPYGCSTAEEQDKITDIDYGQRQIKVKLTSTISPYGIIIFDGDIEPDTEGEFERDFDHFSINAPNRFYMQKGEELWFNLNSHCWDSWWQLKP